MSQNKKCHKKWNESKEEMSQKMGCNKNYVTKDKIEQSIKLINCNKIWNVTKDEVLLMKDHNV